jgi:hypothetical protein
MGRWQLVFLLVLVVAQESVVAQEPAQDLTVTPLSRHLLTNDSVIMLAKAGFDELFIVERIHTSRTHFDTSVEGLIALKQAGVSEDLIRVMALHDLHNYPTPLEAAPAGSVQPTELTPTKMTMVKHWWGYRWIKIN